MRKIIVGSILGSALLIAFLGGKENAYGQVCHGDCFGIETGSDPAPKAVCPNDMQFVEGDFCPNVLQECLRVDKSIHNVNGYVKCDEFEPTKCLSKNTIHMAFCIDTYEWPNKKGELPKVMMTWYDMKKNCESVGKRLCVDNEWTKACEGQDNLPYPYGLVRDAGACNIDHAQRPHFDASKDKMTPEMVAYLDQRVPSGSMERCVSKYGVHDMTGNVDESVINSSGHPYKSGEKGGAWLFGHRNRCRPMTTVHNEESAFYEFGGRCCSDPK